MKPAQSRHEKRLHLVLCWHMHQPDYRHALTHDFELPWTYLHALKDYTDMAAHLERHPAMKAVVNLVPSLMEQLLDYADQSRSGQWRDPLLRALDSDSLAVWEESAKVQLIAACLRCHAPKMIDPFPGYCRLRDALLAFGGAEQAAPYVSEQFLYDLLVWYHLAWTGETVRKDSVLVQQLMAQGSGYTYQDRQQLLRLIGQLLTDLLPRYMALQQRGQVELATTPASHPIVPLLLDFASAREALPHLALPDSAGYPGGLERAQRHIDVAREFYREQFGVDPQGFWPAEGALSTATLQLFAQSGLRWTATGETLLANSLRLSGQSSQERSQWLYQPYRYGTTKSSSMLVYFRDDLLSDKVGFEYAHWDGDSAARDFIAQLETIYHHTPDDRDPVVTVILDGENAWEYYPYNGFYFLDQIYTLLTQNPLIHATTFSEMTQSLARSSLPVLRQVVAGSWVYGTLTTWIGDADKNRAWDWLVAAKEAYDRHVPQLPEAQQERASNQLRVCESSDWFWWFGDYNNADSVQLFDRLYRLNLATLYSLLGLESPPELAGVLSHGTQGHHGGGAMRRTTS